jgi:20S proteasome subunit alpha 3
MKQGYTQYGGLWSHISIINLSYLSALGLRPFGVSLLYAGYDPHYQFQLYHSDPSGNYSGWKATCIGANNGTAQSLLKQEYKDDIEVKDAIGLVLRIMSKTMDSTTLGSEEREFFLLLYHPSSLSGLLVGWSDDINANSVLGHAVEFAVLTLDSATKEPKAKIYKPAEIDALLETEGLGKKDEDTEMKAA